MDLYYAVTNYHLLCFILHKMIFNNNNARLLLSEYLVENDDKLPHRIKETRLFKDVIIVDKPEFYEDDEFLSKADLEKRISNINKKIEKKYSKIIRESKNIYTSVDFDEVGIYLINNDIKYNYFEDACGILSREELTIRVLHIRKKFIEKFKALGNNDCVINRYGSLKDQKPGYYNEKDKDFCVKDLLKRVSSDEQKTILKIYNVDKIRISKKKCNLFLTMHYDEIMSREKQKEIYTKIVDYFTSEKEKLVIKPHPADFTDNYKKIFEGSIVLPRVMPSELFPYCIDEKFHRGLTCYSTSIYSLGSILNKIICFDMRIDKTYKDFDKYYAIVEFLKVIKSDKKTNIIFKNVNELQFEKLVENYISNYKKYFTFEDDKKDSIYIVDKITDELKDKKAISLEYDKESTSMIHINKKSKLKDDDFLIGLYNIKYNNTFSVNKRLKYSKYELNIEYIREKDYREVMYKIVKNQGKNIENRIKQYEDKIESLENDIETKNKDLNKLYESTSWKLTAPIRKVGDILRKIKNHL